MPQIGDKLNTGQGRTTCEKCGNPVRFLPVDIRGKVLPHDMDNLPHSCTPHAVKVYTLEEKLEFAKKRERGEI